MNYVITISKHLCTGCGLCEHNFPGIFRVGRSGAEAVKPIIDQNCCEHHIQRLRELEESCPASAISISGASSTKLQ